MFGIRFLKRMASMAAKSALTGVTVWGWSAPFLIGGMVFTELASIGSAQDLVGTIVVGVVGQLGLGVVIWLSRHTVLTEDVRQHAGLGRVLGVLVAAGATRGALIVVGFDLLAVGNTVYWWERVGTSTLLIAVSFLYAAYSIELWREYVSRRRELLAAIVTTEASVGRQQIATDAYRKLVFEGVEEDIERAKGQTFDVIDTISERIESGGISSEELEGLFGESDRAWRDVSHRAWAGANAQVPRITLRELVITLLGSSPLSLIMFVFAGIYGLFRVLGPELGLSRAAAIMLAITAGQLVVGWLVNRLSTTGPPWNQMSFGSGIVIFLWWPLWVAGLFALDPLLVAVILWLAVVSVVLSIFIGLPVALAKSGDEVLAQLEKRVDESAIAQLRSQGEMFVLAQKVGTYLHGPLRSEFLQLSMELRSALEKNDPFEVANTLSRLRDVVGGVDHDADRVPDVSQFLGNWAGLITVDTNIEDIHIPSGIHDQVMTVVTEAVNNAIRHGNARHVGAFFRYRPEGLLVEVIGAPLGGQDPGEAGLGAHILNEIAPGMWFHDVTEDGRYRLRVTIRTS